MLTTPVPDEEERKLRTRALGSIEGIVHTLQRREGLVFALYDSLLDRRVLCYLQPEQEEKMREIWGKRVRVTGSISRDAPSRAVLSPYGTYGK